MLVLIITDDTSKVKPIQVFLSQHKHNNNFISSIMVAGAHGDVVELVDTLVLGTSASRREGSSPFIPTNYYEKQHHVMYVPGILDDKHWSRVH